MKATSTDIASLGLVAGICLGDRTSQRVLALGAVTVWPLFSRVSESCSGGSFNRFPASLAAKLASV